MMRRGYDELATWRYAQRGIDEDERRLDREARVFSIWLAAVAALGLAALLAGLL